MGFDFKDYVEENIANLEKLQTSLFQHEFEKACQLILTSLDRGGKFLVCGNGGSFSDAQHIAGELVNYFTIKHQPLPVITLGSNQTVSTAWSNDHDFTEQFAREVRAYGDKESVLLGITTSGTSRNLLKAFDEARSLGMRTIALASERAKAHLDGKVDCLIPVAGEKTHKIQESHIVVYHALCIYIEQNLPTRFIQENQGNKKWR